MVALTFRAPHQGRGYVATLMLPYVLLRDDWGNVANLMPLFSEQDDVLVFVAKMLRTIFPLCLQPAPSPTKG